MTTQTQIIEALKAAKHRHLNWCGTFYCSTRPCNCGSKAVDANIDAAIAELEQPEAVQADESLEQVELKRTTPQKISAPTEAVQAEPVACPNNCIDGVIVRFGGGEFDMRTSKCPLHHKSFQPAPKPADEQTVADYAEHYERKWHAVMAECADMQDQLNAANTKIVQMELASLLLVPDVLTSVLGIVEELGNRAQFERWARENGLDIHAYGLELTGYRSISTNTAWRAWEAAVGNLSARLRTALGNTPTKEK